MTDHSKVTPSAEAEEYFQRAIAFDKVFVHDNPDKIRPDLRGENIDHVEARRLYALAAKLGHPKAMNNLALKTLDQFQPTKKDYKNAFRLFERLAEMGEHRGFHGMGGLLVTGFPGKAANDKKGCACLAQAAIMVGDDDLDPVITLASTDLNVLLPLIALPPKSKWRLERGRRILEDAALKGRPDGLKLLSDHYEYIMKDGKKAEFYGREAAKADVRSAKASLTAGYKEGWYGAPDMAMYECVDAIPRKQISDIESRCPRPGGPLTREKVGLPPAPTKPLDIPKYLKEFRMRHPDL